MTRRFGWIVPAIWGVLVVVVGLVRVIAAGAPLTGDRAVLALQVADLAHGRSESVGLYSWHGWSHPGAALFYLLTPFHWLAGGASWGIFLGVGVLSAGCVVLVSWLAFRRRGLSASCFAVALMALTWFATGRLTPLDPWTPYLAVTVFVVFMVAIWGVVERDRGALWIAIMCGALLVQIHVGYVPLVAVIGVTAFASYWWTGGNPRAVTRPLATSLVLFVPWLTDPGRVVDNLSAIVRYFRTSPDPVVGLRRALEVLARESSPQSSWLRGPSETGIVGQAPQASLIWFVVLGIGLLAATVAAYRTRRHHDERATADRPITERLWALAPVVWASLGVSVLGVSRVKGFLFPYVVAWRSVVVLIVWAWVIAVFVLVVLRRLGNARRWSQRPMVAIAGVIVIVASSAALTSASRYDTLTQADVAVERSIEQVVTYLEQDGADSDEGGTRRSVVRLQLGDSGLVGLFPAVLWELEHHDFRLVDVEVGIDEDLIWIFGERALAPGAETTVWLTAETGFGWSLLSSAPGARIVSLISPFTDQAEQRVRALQISIAEQLRAIGRLDAMSALDSPLVALALSDLIAAGALDGDEVEELAAFNVLTPVPGRRFGIVAFETDAVPEIWWLLDPF